MSKETYNIPTGPTARYDYQRNAITLSTSNAAPWAIPAAKMTALATQRTAYELKYAIANNPDTQSPAATAARDKEWATLEALLVDLYDHNLINNAAIAMADKVALHIHFTGGNSGVPTPAPTTAPIVSLVPEEVSMLHVVYSDPSAPGTHYKPANVAFCELIYKVGAPAPTGIAEATERYNVARSHESIVFAPEDRGKTVYAYARWVNKNGKNGPWSNMVSAIIP